MAKSKKNTKEKEKFRAENVFSELTVKEAEIIAVGDSADQRDYVAWLIGERFPAVNQKNRYLTAGMMLRHNSFTACIIAVKNTENLDNGNVLPRLLYAAKSYEKVFQAAERADDKEFVQAALSNADVLRLRALLADTGDTLFGMLMEGKLSRIKYDQAIADKELAERLIREDWENGFGAAESGNSTK